MEIQPGAYCTMKNFMSHYVKDLLIKIVPQMQEHDFHPKSLEITERHEFGIRNQKAV